MNSLPTDESDKSTTWYVYIVRCADNTLYTGMTNDLQRRIAQHNAGTAARYTRARLPVSLVYQEDAANRSEACCALSTLARGAHPDRSVCRPQNPGSMPGTRLWGQSGRGSVGGEAT